MSFYEFLINCGLTSMIAALTILLWLIISTSVWVDQILQKSGVLTTLLTSTLLTSNIFFALAVIIRIWGKT